MFRTSFSRHNSYSRSSQRLWSYVRWQSSNASPPENSITSSAATLQTSFPTPTLPPQPSSAHHRSLETFLAYAQRKNLDPASAVYTGTRYEYQCQTSLRYLGFSLTRTGGSFDAGVDLVGTWSLPSHPHHLSCIVQCKVRTTTSLPGLVRELEGAFTGAPSGWRGDGVIGVLCSTRGTTAAVREAIRKSRRALVWAMVEEGGRVKQLVWNERVKELGAEGVVVGLKYFPGGKGEAGNEVTLMWKGEVWEHKASES